MKRVIMIDRRGFLTGLGKAIVGGVALGAVESSPLAALNLLQDPRTGFGTASGGRILIPRGAIIEGVNFDNVHIEYVNDSPEQQCIITNCNMSFYGDAPGIYIRNPSDAPLRLG